MSDPNRNYDQADPNGQFAKIIREIQEGMSLEVLLKDLGHVHWELPDYLARAIRRQPPMSRSVVKKTMESAAGAFLAALVAQFLSEKGFQGVAALARHLESLAKNPEALVSK